MEPVESPRVFSNRYELTHLIARGGMAQVYRARDRLLDRPVALKVLFPELSVDRAFVERFRREAQAAANLSHANIVPVFDWGEDAGTYFIVMEFVDGRPLSAVLRSSGPLAPGRVADIGVHVAAALSYAHRHGVVHRDIKPGNVLITDDGQVKVTDFGIARAINTEESLTQTGAVMGTAAYFSPEQAEGHAVDARSDIYSLGVVLFEMLTGRTPFLGDSPVAVASKHVRDQPPLPRDLNPGVPLALEAVVMRAMAKSPDERYATAEELRLDLLRFSSGRPVVAGDPATTVLAGAAATHAMGAVNATQAVAQTGPGVPPGAPGAEEEAEGGNKNRRLLILLGVLLVVLAVVAAFLVRSLGNDNVTVPTVTGQTVAAATASLQGKGLVVSGTRDAPSQTVEKGSVVGTSPATGVSVKKGAGITLLVSSGKPPADVKVPNVVTKSYDEAVLALQAVGLTTVKEVLTPSSQPGGTVLSQTPAAGASVSPSTKITLTVSNQSTVPVPNLQGMSQTQAGATLANATLDVGSVGSACSSSGVPNNQIISSSPAAGTPVSVHTPVNLTISSGPCQVTVQNVVGQPQSAATNTLNGQGLQPAPETTGNCSPSANGSVVSQSPPGGTTVNPGSTVTISVCNNTTTTTTTTAPTTTTTTAPTTTTTTAPTTTTTTAPTTTTTH